MENYTPDPTSWFSHIIVEHLGEEAPMIVRGVNIEDLHIDGAPGDIDEMKLRIHKKYGIPVESQRIVCYNNSYSICLSTELHMGAEHGAPTNPLSEFGVPDDAYFSQAGGEGMEHRLLPCVERHEDVDVKRADVRRTLEHMLSSRYREINEELKDEERRLILADPKRYVEDILGEMSRAVACSNPEPQGPLPEASHCSGLRVKCSCCPGKERTTKE
jgi:hypothetical protein